MSFLRSPEQRAGSTSSQDTSMPLWRDVWEDLRSDVKFFRWAARNPSIFFGLVKEMIQEDVVDRIKKRHEENPQESGNRKEKN